MCPFSPFLEGPNVYLPSVADPGLPKTGGGSTGDDIPIIDLPGKGEDHDTGVCEYTIQTEDINVAHKSWKDSGSAEWWKKWIHDHGAKKWSDRFFKQVMDTPGGSTYDCTILTSSSCALPESKACSTYIPPQGYYMHFQISNTFDGFKTLWWQTIKESVTQLSSEIKKIVREYGTPPQEENGDFVNMLVGILTSLAGFGAAKPLFTGTMTSFAGVFTAMSAGTNWEEKVSPDTLEKKLEEAYGDMFTEILNSTENFVGNMFGGVNPTGWSDDKMTDFVYEFFRDGDWLSRDITKPFMNHYITQVQSKWACHLLCA
jgi:hypothetical protein